MQQRRRQLRGFGGGGGPDAGGADGFAAAGGGQVLHAGSDAGGVGSLEVGHGSDAVDDRRHGEPAAVLGQADQPRRFGRHAGGDGEHGKKASLNTGRVGTGGPGYKFADEPFGGDYYRGAVAMANAGPNTNGSQFFICLADLSASLPKKYTIFGQVTKGLGVVDAIAAAPIGPRDLPADPVAMTTVTIVEEA